MFYTESSGNKLKTSSCIQIQIQIQVALIWLPPFYVNKNFGIIG